VELAVLAVETNKTFSVVIELSVAKLEAVIDATVGPNHAKIQMQSDILL
jgi:hypothetical protein